MFNFYQWSKGREPQAPKAAWDTNFGRLLSVMEAAISDDKTLKEELSKLNWLEPIAKTSGYQDPNFHGGPPTPVIATELVSPLRALINLGNERLLRLSLREDLIPERIPKFSDRAMQEPMSACRSGKEMWSQVSYEAFAQADALSAALALEWSDRDRPSKFHPRDIKESPLAALAKEAGGRSKQSQAACLDLGLEQVRKWADGWYDPKNKGGVPAQEKKLIGQALARLLPVAAEAGNIELCELLLERGAAPSRAAILGAASGGKPALFWVLTRRAQADPGVFESANSDVATENRHGMMAQEDQRDLQPLVQRLSEAYEWSAQRSGESHWIGKPVELSEQAPGLALFLSELLTDGARLPDESTAAWREGLNAAQEPLARLASALKSPELCAAIDAAYPMPTPAELGALFEMGDAIRFKERVAIAVTEAKGGSKKWAESQKQELANELMAAVSRIPEKGGGSRSAFGSKPASKIKPDEAFDALIDLEAAANGALPQGKGGAHIIEASSLGSKMGLSAQEQKGLVHKVLSRLQAIALDSSMAKASGPGRGSLKV